MEALFPSLKSTAILVSPNCSEDIFVFGYEVCTKVLESQRQVSRFLFRVSAIILLTIVYEFLHSSEKIFLLTDITLKNEGVMFQSFVLLMQRMIDFFIPWIC